ncbi:MAG: hypothetical protein ACI9WU_004031 [Myxococcota bacterium]|jgi:hypothetical protein
MREVLVVAVAIAAVGCGVFGPIAVPIPVEDKDFVSDAKTALTHLKGEYVLTKGMVAVLEQKVDEFLYMEDGLKLGRVKWKSFRGELSACWQTPFKAADEIKSRTVTAVDAAKHLKNNKTLHEAKAVQDTAWNAVQKVQACPQALTDKIKGMPRRASDEAKAWSQGKMQILNDARVIIRNDIPMRIKALPATAVNEVTTIGKQIASAKGWQETLKGMGGSAKEAMQKNQAQLKTLEGIKAEASNLQKVIGNDSSALKETVADATRRVANGINEFKK